MQAHQLCFVHSRRSGSLVCVISGSVVQGRAQAPFCGVIEARSAQRLGGMRLHRAHLVKSNAPHTPCLHVPPRAAALVASTRRQRGLVAVSAAGPADDSAGTSGVATARGNGSPEPAVFRTLRSIDDPLAVDDAALLSSVDEPTSDVERSSSPQMPPIVDRGASTAGMSPLQAAAAPGADDVADETEQNPYTQADAATRCVSWMNVLRFVRTGVGSCCLLAQM
jgi:hypothetical protein